MLTHSITTGDVFYYNVREYPNIDATSYTNYIRVTPSNADRIVKSYSTYAPAGKSLYLQADTDKYPIIAQGYWYS